MRIKFVLASHFENTRENLSIFLRDAYMNTEKCPFFETFVSGSDLFSAGIYEWWVSEDCFKSILKKINSELKIKNKNELTFETIKNSLDIKQIESKNWICIYVGSADERIIRRIGNHISKNLKSSTFRRTLAALFGEEKVDSILKSAKLRIFITSKENVKNEEKQKINNHFHILNIQSNHNEYANEIKDVLEELRNRTK